MSVGEEFPVLRHAICSAALKGSNYLDEYLLDCEGLFPTDALEILKSIDGGGEFIAEFSSEKSKKTIQINNESSFLHSSWDFSNNTVEYILNEIGGTNARILFLGTPSIASSLIEKQKRKNHLLIDISPDRIKSINEVESIYYDINLLSGDEFNQAFDICIFDPPWYLNHYLHWLDVAFKSCRDGGKIIFPLFGRLTRPSADSDRETILERCLGLGARIDVRAGAAVYDVPSFERRIFERAGIFPNNWKRADIVIAQVENKNTKIFESHYCTPAPIFESYKIGNRLIEIAFDRHITKTVSVWGEPHGGYVMSSPSMREAANSNSNVFISNGTRLICNRPVEVIHSMREISGKKWSAQAETLMKVGFPLDILDL